MMDWDKIEMLAEKIAKLARAEHRIRTENAVQDLAYEIGFELIPLQPEPANQADETIGFR